MVITPRGLALLCAAALAACSSSAPVRSRTEREPQRTSVILRDWPVGLRPTHEPPPEEAPEEPEVEDVTPEPEAAASDAGPADGDAGPAAVGDGGAAVAAAPSCDEVSAHVKAWMLEELAAHDSDGSLGAIMQPVIEQLAEKIRVHCAEDRWSDEARRCFATADSEDEMKACKDELTPEQDERMKEETEGFKPG